MIVRVVDDGMGGLFFPQSKADTDWLEKTDGTTAIRRGHYGSWIEVLRQIRRDRATQVQDQDLLVKFIEKRQAYLEGEKVGSNPSWWLQEPWTLRDYQAESIAAGVERGRLLLADDVGLGKKLTALGIYCEVWKGFRNLRMVVICEPNDRRQWLDEMLDKVRPEILTWEDVALVQGNRTVRHEALERHARVTIMHYQSVIHDMKGKTEISGPAAELIRAAHMVVMDEVTYLKNPWSLTTSRIRAVMDNTPYRLGMSATPMEKDVGDLHSIMTVIDRDVLGPRGPFLNNYGIYETIYLGTREIERMVDAKNIKHMRKRMAHAYVRRTRAQVKEQLPELVPLAVWVELEKKDMKVYRGMQASARATRSTGEFSSWFSRARQYCLDPRVKGEAGTPTKTEKVIQMTQDDFAGEQILIFTWSVPYCWILKDALPEEAGVINGQVSDQRRDIYRRRFMEGDLRIIIGNSAMYKSLNLQAATVVINCDLPDLPTDLKQRVGRADRIGNKAEKIMVATVLYRDTVEEKMLDRCLTRVKLFEDLFLQEDEIQGPFDGLTLDEMKEML